MDILYKIIALILLIVSVFFSDFFAVEASDSAKMMFGLLMAMIFFCKGEINELKERLND